MLSGGNNIQPHNSQPLGYRVIGYRLTRYRVFGGGRVSGGAGGYWGIGLFATWLIPQQTPTTIITH